MEQISQAGIQLVGISYDNVEVLKEFSDQKGIAFPLLSDKSSQTIRDYGLFDDREKGKYRGVPVPATVVVDQEKRIRSIIIGTITKRHGGSELVKRVSVLD